MSGSTQKQHNEATELKRAINISNSVLNEYPGVDDGIRNRYLGLNTRIYETAEAIIERADHSADLEAMTGEFLDFWQQTAGAFVEDFWLQLSDTGINYVRNCAMDFALQNGQFESEEKKAVIRDKWDELAACAAMRQRFSIEEIEAIEVLLNS